MHLGRTTLSKFLIQQLQGEGKSELAALLVDVAAAVKAISAMTAKGQLAGILGSLDTQNVQGETQKKLDVLSDSAFINTFKLGGLVAGLASEENDEPISVTGDKRGPFLAIFDPLDGSSNIDVNVSVGTIFSIYRRTSLGGPGSLEDFLQRGTDQVAAGYIIYGSSCMLVYTTGKGVNGFTLDPSIGEFCLSHPNMKTPKDGKIYSINEGNYLHFPDGVKKYLKYCQEEDKATERPYSSRYIGSGVADIHRNLITGGVYIYPTTTKSPKGKLRLLYECNPLAFIIEQAGGKATTGSKRIMEVPITELHQRTPLFIGSSNMVDNVMEFMKKFTIEKA